MVFGGAGTITSFPAGNELISSESAKILADSFSSFLKQGFLARYGTLIASFTALFIAVFGRVLARWGKSLLYKPKLKIVGFKKFSQTPTLSVWRLAVKNSGNIVAKKVQAEVVGILDGGKKRQNFLAVPLRWTHLDRELRSILPGQTVYLDLFDQISWDPSSSKSGIQTIRLATRFGANVHDFTRLKEGESKVKALLFYKAGRILRFEVTANWTSQLIFKAELS